MAFMKNQIGVELQLKGQQYMASLKKAETGTKRFASKSKSSLNAMRGAWLGVAAAIGVGISVFSKILKATKKQVEADTKLKAVLRSTAGAAGLTYQELKNMASGLQDVTTYGDETIQGAQALLLTFTSIGRDIFPQALESILNVSTAMGTDLRSSVQQIGKALNNPIQGMAALTRVGIQFTDQQKTQIRTMQQAGNLAGAQAVILGELETQFGGLARAMADTPFGVLEQLANSAGDAAESIGKELLPGLRDLASSFRNSNTTGNGFIDMLKKIARALSIVGSALSIVNRQTELLQNTVNVEDRQSQLQTATAALRNARQRGDQQKITLLTRTVARLQNELSASEHNLLMTEQNIMDAFDNIMNNNANEENDIPGAAGRSPLGGGGGGGRTSTLGGASASGALDYVTEDKTLLIAKLQEQQEMRLQAWTQGSNAILSQAQGMFSQIAELSRMEADTKIDNLSRAYNARRDFINRTVSDEGERNRQIATLDKEEELRKKIALRKAAKDEKKMKTYSAAIEIPTMAARAYSSMVGIPYIGPFLAVGAAAAATIFGLAKFDAIRNQSLPELYGGGIMPGSKRGTPAIIGDRGKPEAVIPLDRLNEFVNQRSEQPMNIMLDGEVIFSNVEKRRYKKANSLGGQNYSYRSVYA
jgi:hypothetical protein